MKIALTAFFALNALLIITLIGKPRAPTTPGSAAVAVFINALFIVGIWHWL